MLKLPTSSVTIISSPVEATALVLLRLGHKLRDLRLVTEEIRYVMPALKRKDLVLSHGAFKQLLHRKRS